MEQLFQLGATYGITSMICAWLLWRDREREKERRADHILRDERQVAIERERIEATKEHTQILSKLTTLIETVVK